LDWKPGGSHRTQSAETWTARYNLSLGCTVLCRWTKARPKGQLAGWPDVAEKHSRRREGADFSGEASPRLLTSAARTEKSARHQTASALPMAVRNSMSENGLLRQTFLLSRRNFW